MAAPSQHPYSRSPNLSNRSYDSSSVSSAPSPKPPSQYLGGLVGGGGRSSAGPPPQRPGIPPLPLSQQAAYQAYPPILGSTVMGRDSLPPNDPGMSSGGLQPAHLQAVNIGSQKRAYRQRRKDPSCDQCRERKVKCDATETSSCSECTSRNVKCQFTKDTNRRMSSIKQVQDLERQVDKVRKENSSLKRMLHEQDRSFNPETETPEQVMIRVPEEGGKSDPNKQRSFPDRDFSRARANLQSFSRGIWKPPAPFRAPRVAPFPDVPRLDLPPRPATTALLKAYYSAAHTMYPIIHWPSLDESIEDMYKVGNLQTVSPSFLSLFFAVLAVGTLFTDEDHLAQSYDGGQFLEISRKMMDPWNDNFVLDDVRTLILTTIFLNEINLRSAACCWLGKALRAAQDIGLHSNFGEWSVLDREMRRRVWWTIYVLDRSLAVELGRPLLIDDADCNVPLPLGVDDHLILDHEIALVQGQETLTSSLLAVIHVVRSYTSIHKAFTSPVIPAARLALFDKHFTSSLEIFPPACDPMSGVPLGAHHLNALIYLLSARLLVHRHHLSSNCPFNLRGAAFKECAKVSVETAVLVARTITGLPHGAMVLLTTHIYRCVLFLLVAGFFEPATGCIRALRYISSYREVAIPCGRALAFFIPMLASKGSEYVPSMVQRDGSANWVPCPPGPGPQHRRIPDIMLQDEELLAYLCPDLQGQLDIAWIWGNLELPRDERTTIRYRPSPGGEPQAKALGMEARTGLTDAECWDWGGWDKLESLVQELAATATPAPAPASTSAPMSMAPPTAPVSSVQQPPVSPEGMAIPPAASAWPTSQPPVGAEGPPPSAPQGWHIPQPSVGAGGQPSSAAAPGWSVPRPVTESQGLPPSAPQPWHMGPQPPVGAQALPPLAPHAWPPPPAGAEGLPPLRAQVPASSMGSWGAQGGTNDSGMTTASKNHERISIANII